MRLRSIACLCLLGILGTAMAQEQPGEDPAGLEGEQAAQPEAGTSAAGEPGPQPEPPAAVEGNTTPPPARSTTRSPDTFKPSEEISEDLSVSFPVDI